MIPIKAASIRGHQLFRVICMIIAINDHVQLQFPFSPLKDCSQMRQSDVFFWMQLKWLNSGIFNAGLMGHITQLIIWFLKGILGTNVL